MKKLLTLVALPLALASVSACDRADREVREDRRAERALEKSETEAQRELEEGGYKAQEELEKGQQKSAEAIQKSEKEAAEELEKGEKKVDKALGEGERETGLGGLGRGEGEMEALTDDQIIAEFQKEIGNDRDIKNVAQDVKLELRDGDLVLTGTVPTSDLSDAIEDYAQKLAGRMVNNEITVSEAAAPAPDLDMNE